MKIDSESYRARPGRARLGRQPTRVQNHYEDETDAKKQLAREVARIAEQQQLLYATDTWSLLVILQARDAAGKDSTISHVLSGVNPQGCQVFSFKQPSATELDHDFLWRTTLCLPERGRIGIFNRSYYEEVLVVRVHPEYLAAQRLPKARPERSSFWEQRYESIRDFEKHLHRNGTKVVKIFLNVSAEEQRRRFIQRIDDPSRNWKFSLGDVTEREHWRAYQKAYADCIAATTTKDSPWYIVPADDKRNARLIVARILVETLAALKLSTPVLSAARRAELGKARKLLSRGA